MPSNNFEDSPLIFLGGIFPPSQMDLIQRESKGVVQNAADALQKSLIKGIASNNRAMVIVNLPYVGSYPRLFNKTAFPATVDEVDGVPLYGQEFPLYRFVKTVFRLKNAFRGLRRVKKAFPTGSKRPVVLVYAAHLPFILAALAFRGFRRKAAVCLIMPDLPQYMAEGGRLYRIAKSVETAIFNRLVKHIDYFVVLTKPMAEKLKLPENRYVVVEGVANEMAAGEMPKSGKRVFMYAGTLAARYGILNLLSAFQQAAAPNAELWICGEGDSRDKVEAAAKADGRIKYLGQMPREEVLKLQFQASVLVNPRGPEGEFTSYSFPSKTMEYMAAGRSVLMYQLPGVPDEYYRYFVSPADSSISEFSRSIEEMAGWSYERLNELGEAGRDFVQTHKNATVQTGKILTMLNEAERLAQSKDVGQPVLVGAE